MRRLHRASSTLRRLPDWELNSSITALFDRSEHLDFLRQVHSKLIDRCSNVPRDGNDLRKFSPAPIPEGLGSRLRVQLEALHRNTDGWVYVFKRRRSAPVYAFSCQDRNLYRIVAGYTKVTQANLELVNWNDIDLHTADGTFLIPNRMSGELRRTSDGRLSLRAGEAVIQDDLSIFECDFSADQVGLISILPIRPATVLDSGNKSHHGIGESSLARPIAKTLEFLGGDHHVCHRVALSRAAGVRGQTEREQALHYAAPSGQRPLTIADTPWRSGAEFDEAVHEVAGDCDLHHATLRLAELAADAETLVGQLVPARAKAPPTEPGVSRLTVLTLCPTTDPHSTWGSANWAGS